MTASPPISEEPLLRVRDLRVGFQTARGLLTAVDGISFDVPKGKTLGLVGESGSGKSVTALSIMRLLPQPMGKILGGSIALNGMDLTQLPIEDMRLLRGNEIGMIFQEPLSALNPVHRIGKQLEEVYRTHAKWMKKHRDQSLADMTQDGINLLKKVGIPAPEQRYTEYPHQLSGGMRQRVVIAMALALSPSLIIADEPTTALDVTIQAQILDLLRTLQKQEGCSVIMITHDLGVIAEMCDEVAVMYAGRIVERAPVEQIFANPLHAYTKGLIHCIPSLNATRKTPLETISGMVPPLHELKPGCRFAPRSGHPYTEADLMVRPPFVEMEPQHWVEASAVCVDRVREMTAEERAALRDGEAVV